MQEMHTQERDEHIPHTQAHKKPQNNHNTFNRQIPCPAKNDVADKQRAALLSIISALVVVVRLRVRAMLNCCREPL